MGSGLGWETHVGDIIRSTGPPLEGVYGGGFGEKGSGMKRRDTPGRGEEPTEGHKNRSILRDE